MLHLGMFTNTYKMFYRQGASNLYTVNDYGDLVYINFEQVSFIVSNWSY